MPIDLIFNHQMRLFFILLIFSPIFICTTNFNSKKLLVITVATEATDGFLRLKKSVENFNIPLKVLGLNQPWIGGDVKWDVGGGQKVLLFKSFLEDKQQDLDENMLVIFVDGYDVIFNADAEEIIKKFLEFDTKILFSAEEYCWPNKSLKTQYPVVKSGKRYLNSGLFMGLVKNLKHLLNFAITLNENDDDQLFYTEIYLNQTLRDELEIKLDHLSKIFQNLNGVTESIDLNFFVSGQSNYDKITVHNLAYNTQPSVIHGNGASKIFLNYLGNYIGGVWNTNVGCVECPELNELKKFLTIQEENLPRITLALFVEKPTPFLSAFFNIISQIDYPKSKIVLFIHNKEAFHLVQVENFIKTYGNQYETYVSRNGLLDESVARNLALSLSMEKKTDFLFSVDSDARFSNSGVLKDLIFSKKKIVAPLLIRIGKLFSNFWGALSDNGFYTRSEDYLYIVNGKRRGLFNVPYINSAYLISSDLFIKLKDAYDFDRSIDLDMSFTRFCLYNGIFMFVDNRQDYGNLINSETFDTKLINPDFYQIFENKDAWENQYLNDNFSDILKLSSLEIDQPCTDVYRFPIFKSIFCQHLIEIMETYGRWSSGSNTDERLQGGYENVPTRDIHLNQVGLERHWLYMLDQYFRPIQEKIFVGYYHQPPQATMNFVVRYRPDEQPFLRPHHDASTYTVNMALNRQGIDFEGGGARFIRYNCSVVDSLPGWALMHPGRLTHFHEGLPTIRGTRYIMVSFVDP